MCAALFHACAVTRLVRPQSIKATFGYCTAPRRLVVEHRPLRHELERPHLRPGSVDRGPARAALVPDCKRTVLPLGARVQLVVDLQRVVAAGRLGGRRHVEVARVPVARAHISTNVSTSPRHDVARPIEYSVEASRHRRRCHVDIPWPRAGGSRHRRGGTRRVRGARLH